MGDGFARSGRELKDRILHRVERIQVIPEGRGTLFRIAWAAAGVTVILAGLAMLLLPGPAIVVIPIGLAMLSAVFGWARRLMTMSIERGVDLGQAAEDLDLRVKVTGALVAICLIAGVGAILVLR